MPQEPDGWRDMNKKIASPLNGSQPQHTKDDITRAKEALETILPSVDRDTWIKVTAAWKAAGGDFDTWDNWSSGADSYCPDEARRTWNSLDANGKVGIGTLFYFAGESKAGSPNFINPVSYDHPVLKSTSTEKTTRAEVIERAESILDACDYATVKHPYLEKKRIKPRLMPWLDRYNNLVIPVLDIAGQIHSLQFISPEGGKRFLSGGTIKGHFYQLWTGPEAIVICEGYATGITLYQHYTPECSVVVAFNAGNLKPVAQALHYSNPDKEIIIAGDCDPSGVGQKKAEEAALAVSGSYSLPKFASNEKGTDFNDRWCLDNAKEAA